VTDPLLIRIQVGVVHVVGGRVNLLRVSGLMVGTKTRLSTLAYSIFWDK